MRPTQLMTVRDFLTHYRVGRTTFYKEVQAGRLRIIKLGQATRVSVADAENWLIAVQQQDGLVESNLSRGDAQ